ncbi:flagellin N-terminal helical domain-containing protein [Shewanella surugensis]|uniref:Flagellin n=1 Tax=Shewanella surugensis TaxID=212020 RepID=A0ABT0LAN7_9GAMM|nr:flagellin [Shewanella surugensis]MCL1124774.1 Lateral flagellin [Shewanella surugensis]
MLSVQTNNASLIAQNSVNKSNDLLANAMERLSTGLRINSSADDAAGLQIATRLNANVTGMETASRNVSDATSMLQTADGALDELTSIANRQKELATQAANGVNSDKDLKALDDEFQQLTAEMTRIIGETTYAGNKLFDVLDTGTTFQIGASSSETLDVKVAKVNLADLAGGGEDVTSLDLATDASAAMDMVDTLVDIVGESRSTLGANINRLAHTASNLANVTENTKAAAGRIMDTDFAVESSNMTKNQLLVQAGTNILSSANQNTGLVLGLLN